MEGKRKLLSDALVSKGATAKNYAVYLFILIILNIYIKN
jgi:hypothetical protein